MVNEQLEKIAQSLFIEKDARLRYELFFYGFIALSVALTCYVYRKITGQNR